MNHHEQTDKRPLTKLEELWELSEKGTAIWWPKIDNGSPAIKEFIKEIAMYIGNNVVVLNHLEDSRWTQFALDIVIAEADRWLQNKGWNIWRSDGRTKYCPPITGQYWSLAEALKHAIESEKEQKELSL